MLFNIDINVESRPSYDTIFHYLFKFNVFRIMITIKLYIFEIVIHFYPNLVVKLATISPKMVVKNEVIFSETPPKHTAIMQSEN